MSATGTPTQNSGAAPEPSSTPTVFVLFGATGDLANRMVIPAFYELHCRGLAPKEWILIGNGRGNVAHEDFRARVRESLEQFGPGKDNIDSRHWEEFARRLRFAGGGFDDSNPGSLLDVIQEAHQHLGRSARYLHYLAVPPVAFGSITSGLAAHQLLDGARVVFEKPYGSSLESFNELDRLVHSVMREDQVFRIDHFLGKEATQNVHVLRFGNAMIDRIWNAEGIAQVQIDAPEDSRRGRPGAVLRCDRRVQGHDRHPSVPGDRRSRDGTTGQHGRGRSADGAGVGVVGVPAAGPFRGRIRTV